ncbi:MAG: hypothetical protein ACRCTD_08920 [Beijerinckiaceae bacterium]
MFLRSVAAVAITFAMAGAALAGASQQPFTPPPVDPALKNATPYVISLKVFDQCRFVQARLMESTQEAVHTPCSCYAKATVAQMGRDELNFFRANGFFNDVTRAKALVNLDNCKLKRPKGL